MELACQIFINFGELQRSCSFQMQVINKETPIHFFENVWVFSQLKCINKR